MEQTLNQSWVTTHCAALWDAMLTFKDHGIAHKGVFGREYPPGFRWLHERFGSNFPPHRTAERRWPHPAPAHARVHRRPQPQRPAARAEALADCSAVRVPLPPDGITHSWYQF